LKVTAWCCGPGRTTFSGLRADALKNDVHEVFILDNNDYYWYTTPSEDVGIRETTGTAKAVADTSKLIYDAE
jgi:hypothetical protein